MSNRDTALGGFKIRKNSLVFVNIFGIHHDEEIWGSDVHEFKPERFWNKGPEEEEREKNAFMPFARG